MTQPEALRLADTLIHLLHDWKVAREAAAELRRLHEVNQELVEALKIALNQNQHDMVMTAEECRKAEDALAKAGEKGWMK